MKRKLIDFPAIYNGQGEPTGDQWKAKFQIVAEKAAQGGIVVLLGNRGTGKTRMAYEIAKDGELPNDMMERTNFREARPALYRTAMEIFMELRSTYSKSAESSEYDIFGWYRSAALLVIDEMQERGETPFEDQKLTAIIDARYREGRSTIIIGNYSARDFNVSVSPSIISRIQESGGVIDCKWGSYRLNP